MWFVLFSIESTGPNGGLNDKLHNLKKLLKGKFHLIYENTCDSKEKQGQ